MRQLPLSRLSWTTRLALSLCLLLIVGWIDFVTGYETSLAIFYGLPIGLAVALCGKRTAFLISALAGVTWFWVDVTAGHTYADPVHHALETCLRLGFFFLIVVAGAALKAQHQSMAARIKLLEQNRTLEQQIVQISEHEQQRIGQDLHDGLCQYFAALAFSASALQWDLKQSALPEFATAAGELSRQINEGIVQMRNLARGLTPLQAADGLVSALEELAGSVSRSQGIDCTFTYDGATDCEKGLRATHLFRIAQQAVHNATTHGNARHIDVRLTYSPKATALSVSDDGVGMPARNDSNGMGINIMRYRATALGGELVIENRAAGGTVVSCTSRNQPGRNGSIS